MKRALLGTLWIGGVAAGIALALSLSGLLARPALALDRMFQFVPNESPTFLNSLLIVVLSFALAWVMLAVNDILRRVLVLFVVILELIGAAWVWSHAGMTFSPWAPVIAVLIVTLLAVIVRMRRTGWQSRAVQEIFAGRLGQTGRDRLIENPRIDFSQPVVRTNSFVFCEIANEPELIEELSPPDCAKLTREFIERASKHFLKSGGYLHAADGEGIRILFGFPIQSPTHAVEAARSALAFRDQFHTLAAAQPDSLGKIDLRIGISSGTVVATLREDQPGSELLLAGEPLELGRRLARANQIYGSEILLDPATFSAAGKEILARPMDFLRSAEAHDRLEVYELLSLADRATPEEVARRDCFWTAVVYFRERRWNEAFAEFHRARGEAAASDRPLQWYLRRLEPLCLKMAAEPTPVTEPFAPNL